ncbi:uncharacterized protein B0I36DRAFT_425100 [Microdochium trichocladiopsis]|uniref:Peptidase S33 tripeptidyl aminopeptidase-like C-terminal domain-containing protein n=1 Tax=Microdochium trichocladiopsis TaxID=1682393 RepID=A0A9P8XYN2_9PEZI|nr:uncharacterized protein B0I36DRAFT_425100 [Microdochium trichocladiopsis]KAH7021435.1 hypothetical protein B0I36DRAFT_425100 [Microdochium trichocladiopsis]
MHRRCLGLALMASVGCKAACQTGPTMVHSFEDITSSTNITWTPCFDNFLCTKLQVPLDYANTSLGTTDVAFVKLPGKNATADTPNIVFIMGGPGGSGIDMLVSDPDRPRAIFGEQYNIVSFDPRGINNSGQTLDCFSGNDAARETFIGLHSTGTTNTSTESLQEQFYSSPIYADSCEAAMVTANSPHAYYVTTPAVARDLLAYTEAEVTACGQNPQDAKLWAYAVSYGTVTGATFATLFPERVGRLVLDGVMNAEQYYDNVWLDSMDQTDAAVEYFAETCHAAGADVCPFWGPSAEDILGRLDRLIEQLRDHPVPISGVQEGQLPTMVTYADIKALLFAAVYTPPESFPGMAETLFQVESGNASALAGTYAGLAAGKTDPGRQIQCADAARRNKMATIEQFAQYVEATTSRSRYVGDVWPMALDGVLCSALRPELPESMLMQEPIGAFEKPTAFPIMVASNTVDPLTPLNVAKTTSALFKDAVLVQQQGVGHTVVGLSGSTCYFTHLQMYFAGIVPPANVTCPQEHIPFKQ